MVVSHHPNKWLLYYQGALAVGAVFFFFTFIDAYIVEQQIATSPLGWMLPYFILTVPLFILGRLKFPSRLVIGWCAAYLLINAISYLSSPAESALPALIERSFASVFLFVTACLFSDQRVQRWVRLAIVAATLLGVLNNCYQFVNPDSFAGLVDSRVSGFYMDPNDCSYGLVLGMILAVGIFPDKFRIPWVLIVGFGVAITLSRGGILCWLIVVMLMCLTRIIPYKQSGLWILGISALLLGLIASGAGDNLLDLGVFNQNAFSRIDGIINGETLNDPSAVERKGILEKAWTMFLENPLFGEGIGSTSDYSITGFTVSTHNMYLLHAAEYGLIGLPLLPCVVYASTHQASGRTRTIANIFILFVLFSSCFSHTVLNQRSYLVAFALMAAMGAASRIRPTLSNLSNHLEQEQQFTALSSSGVHK